MQCPRCQQENRQDRRFCSECGASLAPACPSCGFSNEPGEKFCGGCGQPLRTTSTAKFAAPDSYTPRHLAEKILTSKSALEGERKQVTVLFADLKGSMELLADRDPEEARKLLDPVLGHMMEAVHRYEGTVNQVMGDGIMALFGAPLAHEDHAVRACYAALNMQDAVRRHAEVVERQHGPPLHIRVGLNSGEVVVRSVGSDLRMDYTAVGQTTHLAARMEQVATPGTILLTADTLRLAEGHVAARPIGPVSVKGLPDPLEVYLLTGAGPIRRRFEAARVRGLTRFVGRDAEMTQLRRALTQAGTGHGQVVAVVGEAGSGKSRLLHELSRSHDTEGWLVLETGCLSYGRGTPYLPIVDVLRAYFRIEAHADARTVHENVTGKVATLDRALDTIVPPLLALLDVPVERADWQGLDPVRRRTRTRDAVRALLLRESQAQPLLVVFEDLHWIDSETQALLDGLVESLPGAHALLLVSYRPEYQHAWGRKTYYTRLRVDPLPAESVRVLLDDMLGDRSDVASLRQPLIEATEGNPFFLEEMVQTLVEIGVLAGERGTYRLARSPEALHVPATVQAVLAARIDRLPSEDKRLLQSAAVVGKHVPFALLQAIAEEPEASLRAGLARLGAAEFLYERVLFPELEYTFKHALTHEVAYASILGGRRRELHLRIVESIERLRADRLDEHVDALAHHARRAELWEKAWLYLRQAGTKASARLALREAAGYLEEAVAVADRLPRRRDILEQSIDLRVALRGPLGNLGEFDRLRDHLGQGALLAREIDDRVRLARITLGQASLAIYSGETAEALHHANDAVGIAGVHPVAGNAHTVLGMVQFARGDYHAAIRTARANVERLRRESAPEPGPLGWSASLASRTWMTLALAEVGRFSEAFAAGEEVVRESEVVANVFALYRACYAIGAAQLLRGELEHASESLRRAERISAQTNLDQTADYVSGLLGHADALAGHPEQALQLLERSVIARKRREAFIGLRDLLYLGDAYLRSGRLDDARGTARQALDLARTSEQHGQEAYALRLLGEVHDAQGARRVAEASLNDALGLASKLTMRPLVAHCHFGLGKLYRRTDKRERAQEHLTTATTMYREMGMPYWLKQAEAELRTRD